ncbi:hypothetical protein C8J56DRAFT_1002094 [Mycena floridula]|nr:hypothetical protein C8J56DRAFT_1002094 [Mycena floridula]
MLKANSLGRLLARPRRIHSSSRLSKLYDPRSVERADDEVDVCIVGAGPAGLSAAIRIKQLQEEKGKEIRVVVLDKGSEVGAHILSGAVMEPRAMYELLGDPSTYIKKYGSAPWLFGATKSRMLFLTDKHAIPIPHPPQMGNDGNFICSLSAFTRWLAEIAESHYGVEIYPGFSAAGLVFSEEPDAKNPWTDWQGKWGTSVQSVVGVITSDVGVSRSGRLKDTFEPGMIFKSKVTLLAEGAHGSLSKLILDKYKLRQESEGQTYGFGLKEVWRVAPEDSEATDTYKPGEVVHTLGYPLDTSTYGGGWVYHMDKGLVSLGLVLGADWENPYREPYRDLQKMKHHPYIRRLLTTENSGYTPNRIAYGARILTEGGLQSVPLLHFPGGALIGCSAGFVNIAKIKGIHNAMKTGMMGGEGAFEAIEAQSPGPADLSSYSTAFTKSWVYDDLHEVRNLRPSFAKLGLWGGVAYSGIDTLLLKGKGWWTFRHSKEEDRSKYLSASPSFDSAHTKPASQFKPIEYPPFEPPLSTDLMTSVALTGTNHAEDQLIHLRLSTLDQFRDDWYGTDSAMNEEKAATERKRRHEEHVKINVGQYAGLLGHACPAGVYEYVPSEESTEGWKGKKLVINSQNCIHCKLCDVKVPTQDITWTVPEGGGGPKYSEWIASREGMS